MRKYRCMAIVLLILMLIGFTIAFSGCINSYTATPTPTQTLTPTYTSTPTPTPTPKPIVYGYITTISLDKMKTELVDLDDNYDNYEVESNVGTVDYRGYTYQTHRVNILRGDLRNTVNNVVEYELTDVVKSRYPKQKLYGWYTTITGGRETTKLIKFSDNYDNYEVEENVGTVSHRGYSHVTHKITFWRGDTKRVINNMVAFHLKGHYI